MAGGKLHLVAPKGQMSAPVEKAVETIARKEAKKVVQKEEKIKQTHQEVMHVAYKALTGIQYLVQDLYSMPPGDLNLTVVGSANRFSDRIKPTGFYMNYYFGTIPQYSIGVPYYPAFIKIRIMAFTSIFTQTVAPATAEVLDFNFFGNLNGCTLNPINYDKGIVKRMLYDKVKIVRATNPILSPTAVATLPYANVYHLKKFIKFKSLIHYNDNNTTFPDSTREPIYVAITAEFDESWTALTPSGTGLLFTTGYTQGFFRN